MLTRLINPLFACILVAVVVALLAGAFLMRRDTDTQGPLSSHERAQELAKEGKRGQILTVSDGMIALDEASDDTAPRLFAVPIGQITLATPQSFRHAITDSSSPHFRGFKGRSNLYGDTSRAVYGAFNNVLIYDKVNGSLTKVFDERIAISAFKHMNRTTPRSLVITAASVDTDRDGAIDDQDFQRLYVFTIADGQLHEVTGLIGSAGLPANIDDVDYVIVETTLDTDRDGRTRQRRYSGGDGPEPQRLYRVDLKTFTATPLLDAVLIDDLQATLDGVAPAQGTN
jgi:hypothetical protein